MLCLPSQQASRSAVAVSREAVGVQTAVRGMWALQSRRFHS